MFSDGFPFLVISDASLDGAHAAQTRVTVGPILSLSAPDAALRRASAVRAELNSKLPLPIPMNRFRPNMTVSGEPPCLTRRALSLSRCGASVCH